MPFPSSVKQQINHQSSNRRYSQINKILKGALQFGKKEKRIKSRFEHFSPLPLGGGVGPGLGPAAVARGWRVEGLPGDVGDETETGWFRCYAN